MSTSIYLVMFIGAAMAFSAGWFAKIKLQHGTTSEQRMLPKVFVALVVIWVAYTMGMVATVLVLNNAGRLVW